MVDVVVTIPVEAEGADVLSKSSVEKDGINAVDQGNTKPVTRICEFVQRGLFVVKPFDSVRTTTRPSDFGV